MAYESQAEPIKLGYLFDFVLPDGSEDLQEGINAFFERRPPHWRGR